MRSRRDADRPRRADPFDLSLERPFTVEHLNALIAAIGDIHAALRVDINRVRRVELALPASACAPRLEEPPCAIELRDARIAVSVRNVDVPRRVPGNSRRLVEIVAGHT